MLTVGTTVTCIRGSRLDQRAMVIGASSTHVRVRWTTGRESAHSVPAFRRLFNVTPDIPVVSLVEGDRVCSRLHNSKRGTVTDVHVTGLLFVQWDDYPSCWTESSKVMRVN